MTAKKEPVLLMMGTGKNAGKYIEVKPDYENVVLAESEPEVVILPKNIYPFGMTLSKIEDCGKGSLAKWKMQAFKKTVEAIVEDAQKCEATYVLINISYFKDQGSWFECKINYQFYLDYPEI